MNIEPKIYGMVPKFKTHCCALAQLSLTNNESLEEIEYVIEEMKKEANEPLTREEEINFGMKERAVFVITLPHETRLVENLEKLGFQMIYEFHRRSCYPEHSMLKMWIISW